MLIKLPQGGSGAGLSYWGQFDRTHCPKRITLNEQVIRENPQLLVGHGGSDGSDRGLLFHAMAEHYHAGKNVDPRTVVFEPSDRGPAANATAYAEATSLFDWWTRNVPRQIFGEVIATEWGVSSIPHSENYNALFAGEIEALFPGGKFSTRLDMVTDLETRQVDNLIHWLTDVGCPVDPELLRPGTWVIDWKTGTDIGNAIKYASSWQEIAYPWSYKTVTGDEPVGFLFVYIAVGRKKIIEPKIEVIVHPYPSEPQIRSLFGYLSRCMSIRDVSMADPMQANRLCCPPGQFDKAQAEYYCPHWRARHCPGF